MSRVSVTAVCVAVGAALLAHSCGILYFCVTDPDTCPACRLQGCTLLPGQTNNGLQLGLCADGTTRSVIGAPVVDAAIDVVVSPCALRSMDPLDASAAYTYVEDGVPGALPRHPGLSPLRSRLAVCTAAGLVAAIACSVLLAWGLVPCVVPLAAGAAACGAVLGCCAVLWWSAGATATMVSCHPGVCAPDVCTVIDPVAPRGFQWRAARCDVYGDAEVFVGPRHTPSAGRFRASRCVFQYDGPWPTPPGLRAVALYQMDPAITLGADGVPQACVFASRG